MKDKIYKKIRDYVISNYKKINIEEFVLGDCTYNFRCQLNAVQKSKLFDGIQKIKVLSCIAIHKETKSICIHFINQFENDGKYQDNTWGWLYEEYDYYLIKELTIDEQKNIGDYFRSLRSSIIEINSTKIERFFANIHDYNDFI